MPFALFGKKPLPQPPFEEALSPFASLVGFALLQAIIWFLLSQANSPITLAVNSYINRIPNARKNVYLNVKKQYEEAGFVAPESESKAVTGHCFSYVALVHHSLGTLFLIASYVKQSELLFRVGLSFEIGEGVQHSSQIVHALLRPPGTMPICDMSKPIWAILACHHSLGLLAGSVAHVYLASNPDVQLLCALLLGAAVPGFINLPLMALGDLNGTGWAAKINIALSAASFAFVLYTRVIIFLPMCIRLTPTIFALYGSAAGWMVAVSLVLFSLFNIVALVAAIASVVNGIRKLHAGPVKPSLTRLASKSMSNLVMVMSPDRPNNVEARAAFSPLLNQTAIAMRFVAKLKARTKANGGAKAE